jgi:hypothetical protein
MEMFVREKRTSLLGQGINYRLNFFIIMIPGNVAQIYETGFILNKKKDKKPWPRKML